MTGCHGCAFPCHLFLPPPFSGPGFVDVDVDVGEGVDVSEGVDVGEGVDGVDVDECHHRW